MTALRNNPFDDELLRVRLVLVVMLAALTLLGVVLWRIQVAHGERYENSQVKQSIRRVRLPAMRGKLFDRNGFCVADNRPSYAVALYLEELRVPGPWARTIDRVDGMIGELAAVLELERTVTREDIRTHIRKRLPLPLLAWRDIDERTLARLAERAVNMPGVDVYVEAVRFYPLGASACHVLGYVGRADPPQDEDERYHFYLPDLAGKSGLEKSLDNLLRGEAGGRLMRVDVSGFRRHEIGQREALPGRDVQLSLDARIQRLAEDAIGDEPGAVVVLDPANGDVLAMASTPGYDPNSFIPAISTETWSALMNDERKPLVNRAAAGAYAPGSTFKPVVAMAALESGKLRASQTFDCPGYFELGRTTFRCWLHSGHGVVNMRQALERSCNVYFFHAGLLCGPDAIFQMAAALGFGQKTGIELDYEVAGLVPNDAWKRRLYDDAWRDGDTCNISIGQGALTATPLQMAMATAALANGGLLYRPRLVIGIRDPGLESFTAQPPEILQKMNWSREHVDAVRVGMRDVIMAAQGTGRAVAHPGVVIAGKTGTAEFGRKEDRRRHAWMIAFAPYDAPRYAVALLVDEGVSGSETAAPRMKKLMSGLLAAGAPAGGQG